MTNSLAERFQNLNVLVAVPTYNNPKTLGRILDELLALGCDVLVVNDGSNEECREILDKYEAVIQRYDFATNQGKGMALRKAFKLAAQWEYRYLISIDSDGQHYPSDLVHFLDAIEKSPDTLLMGSRNMSQEDVPGKSSFGNRFSNFWFFVETGLRLPDTQTGFRLYPVKEVNALRLFTRKFELEIEVIVKLAWRGVPIQPVPIRVKYDPAERVSHFRPFKDFTRISILNTYLVVLTLLWYLPVRILRKNWWQLLKNEIIKPEESAKTKALSVGFGLFFGIVPIWGFQLAVGIPFAIFTRLNKVLFVTAAHISIPPMIPVILFFSFLTGGLFFPGDPVSWSELWSLERADIHRNLTQYLFGACLLAVAVGLVGFAITYAWVRWSRGRKLPRSC